MRRKLFERLGLRTRLTLLVSAELVATIIIAVGISQLLHALGLINWNVPTFLELILFSLLIGALVTFFLAKIFFDPIKKLGKAMNEVAKGNFGISLQTDSTSQEIREIYSGFNLMTRELSATEILQTDFVSNVSHEFKTPINAIEGYATLLQDCENLTPEQRQYVDKIYFNTCRLSGLLGNILLLSKLENQNIHPQGTTFRLDEQIRQALLTLEPAWTEKELLFDVDLDRIEYTGQEGLMYHIWSNLISNAVKFSPPGATVRLRLTRRADKLIFTVEDEGCGISEEALEHIFDKFYQADSSHKQEGNGLGLALTKRIVAIENGTIQAENRAEGGCRFTVIL